MVLLHWAVIVYVAVRLALVCWRGSPTGMAFGFWAFSYAWLGVAGLAHLLSGRNPLRTSIGDSLATQAALVILAGFVAYDIGGTLTRRRRRERGWPSLQLAQGA